MLSKNDKNILTDKVINILNAHNITNEMTTLEIKDCINIINEIIVCVQDSINLTNYIKNVSAEEKPGVIVELIMEVLSSPKLKENISPEVKEQIRQISNNTQIMGTVLNVVNNISSELLETLDTDNNGLVTTEEVEVVIADCLLCKNAGGCSCYKADECCACCPVFSHKVGDILGKFFIKILCCGCEKNYIARK